MQEIIPHDSADADNRPLPLIVAEKWEFKLAHVHEVDGVFWYAVQDWIVGVLSVTPRNATLIWADARRNDDFELLDSIQQFPYKAINNKTYMMDFTTDKNLYILIQGFRLTKKRRLLAAIRDYLAKAGAFVDEVRREPEKVVTSGAIDPETALEAVIKMYQRQGKSDEWIRMRINTKIHRVAFISALKASMAEIVQFQYGQATNQIYLGLWNRTAKRLKEEMGLGKTANLRDYQPTAALYYQGLAEDACARELGDKQELTWGEAVAIIQDAALFVGAQARAYGERYKIDLATGQPLLLKPIPRHLRPAISEVEDDDLFDDNEP